VNPAPVTPEPEPVAEVPTTPTEPGVTGPLGPIGPTAPQTPTETPSRPTEPAETPTAPAPVAAETVVASTTIAPSTSESADEVAAEVAVAVAVADDDGAEAQLAQSVQDDAAERRMTPLMKVMWSFAVDQPVQRARVLRSQVGEATLAASTVSVDPILKVVQEFTLIAPDAYGEATSAQAVNTGIVADTSAARASLAAALVDSNNSTRNIILALAAGSATLAITWYRARQRKLQIAAMKLATLMQFDPLAVWCDDAEDEREFV
jgi:hypothetical protein